MSSHEIHKSRALLVDDIVAVVASFLSSIDLRITFQYVYKRWYEIGKHVVNGTIICPPLLFWYVKTR